ncbi:hypothetical protein B0H14DRAFT_2675709 [Mycena olivaceomarginata]|nr:hypothetical protein B0H14DRAFT_2675709 [Mycena olivaceomarginata]
MTDERPAIQISPNDNEALEQIIEQYKDGGCDRNDVIAALFGSIASICSLQNLSTDYSLLLSYIGRIDAYDQEQAGFDRSRGSTSGHEDNNGEKYAVDAAGTPSDRISLRSPHANSNLRGHKRYSVCKNYSKGRCSRNNNCKYQHIEPAKRCIEGLGR